MNPPPQSSSPSSPVTTGTVRASGAMVLVQHAALLQPPKLYSWNDTTSWASGSAGSCDNQPLSSLDQLRPPSMIGCAAPVARTALTNDCIPAACHGALAPLPAS